MSYYFWIMGKAPLLKDNFGNNACLYCKKKQADAKANNRPENSILFSGLMVGIRCICAR